MRKYLDCFEITLFLFCDIIFHLSPNYLDLVKSEYGLENTHRLFSFGLYTWVCVCMGVCVGCRCVVCVGACVCEKSTLHTHDNDEKYGRSLRVLPSYT